jgi:hypothetical protein
MNAQAELQQLETDRRRGQEADLLLKHPLLQEARQSFYDDLAQQRRGVPIRDTDLHTRLVLAEQVAARVFDYLEAVIRQGEAANLMLRERERFTERLNYAMQHGLRNAF